MRSDEIYAALFAGQPRALRRLWEAKRAWCRVTHDHEIGVGEEVRALSLALGWDRATADDFAACAMFHDVGKTAVPRAILNKPGRLTPAEMAVMKTHAAKGAEILAELPGLLGSLGAAVAHWHHERPDGLGYHGLKGEEIPMAARICSVADVYEALTAVSRPYKAGLPIGETLVMMTRDAEPGRLGRAAFDPMVLTAFVDLKLTRHRGDLSPDEADALREFVREGRVDRKIDVQAFRMALDRFEREVGGDRARAAARAGNLVRAAARDPEKRRILEDHPSQGAVAVAARETKRPNAHRASASATRARDRAEAIA